MLDPRANTIEYQGQLELIKQMNILVTDKRNGKPSRKTWLKLIKAAKYLDILGAKDKFTDEQLSDLTYIYDCLISLLNINRFPSSPSVGLITTPLITVGVPGPPGADGVSSYLYFAWADDTAGTGFTTTFNPLKPYLAFIQSSVPLLILNVGMFSGRWFKVLGTDGADGTDGIDGIDGTDGIDGEDGKTILSGTSNPTGGTGVDGDFYINTNTWFIFGPKVAGAWPAGVSIIGPSGTNGIDGKTILTGSGTPSNGLGNNGDIYIDTAAWNIHGPKASGVWPVGVSLIGPQGDPGDTGPPGTPGNDGDNGIDSFIYVAYADSSAGANYILVQSNDETATLSSSDPSKTYIAILSSATAIGTTITAADFTGLWIKFAGDGDRWTTFSTTTLTIGTGSVVLTVEQNLAYSVGQFIVIADVADPDNRMEGLVNSYNPSTGALVATITADYGAGTFSNWAVSLQASTVDPPTTYGGASPSTVAVNDVPAGTNILGQTYDYLFEHIYAPFVNPTFASFVMSGQATVVEVGTTISGSQTFTWTTTSSGNVAVNSIDIDDITGSTNLITGTANDGTHSVGVGTVQKIIPALNTWRITGDYASPGVGSFTRDFTVNWYWRQYSGTSANVVLTEAQIEALTTASLAASPAGTFVFAAGDYKYICYADGLGNPATSTGFRDTSTNLAVAMADSTDNAAYSNTSNGWSYALVSVTNALSIAVNYRVYRTKFTLGGAINILLTLA